MYVLILLTLAVLLAASYSDIKTREVPNWLSYGLIFSAFAIRAIFSFELGWEFLASGVLGFMACLVFAYLFYYTHQWGGGDSKLLMGMGAVIGITYSFNNSSFDLLWFFLALLFLGALYGLIWMAVIAIKKKKAFKETFSLYLKNFKTLQYVLIGVTAFFIILTIFYIHFWVFIIFPLLMFYLFLFVSSVEKSCFVVRVNPLKLVEGDWLAEPLEIEGKKFKKTLTLKNVEALHHLYRKKKIHSVLVKEGIPFVPSFLFAYVFILVYTKVLF